MVLQLGWFSTGRGNGSRDLLATIQNAIDNDQINCNIQFVFSNREPGETEGSDRFLDLVHELGIDLICHSSKTFRANWNGAPDQWRRAYDLEVMNKLSSYTTTICVLAGYMLIIGKELCKRYSLINLHPATPEGPKGKWQDVIWSLINEQATQSGINIHLATEDLDEGPTLTYCVYPIRGHGFDKEWDAIPCDPNEKLEDVTGEDFPLFKKIRKAGTVRELPLLVQTLKLIAEGKIHLEPKNCIKAQDLTLMVESLIAST